MNNSHQSSDPNQTPVAANGEPATALSVATLLDQFRPALLSVLSLPLLTGVLFPLILFLLRPPLFPGRARGSLLMRGSIMVRSELIGQSFTAPAYFHPRPSAAGAGYDTITFGVLVLGTIVLVGALSFLPALVLGPIVEFLQS